MNQSDLQKVAAKLPLSKSVLARNKCQFPELFGTAGETQPEARQPERDAPSSMNCFGVPNSSGGTLKPLRGAKLLNKTESRWCAVLEGRGLVNIMKQAITLRLDPPFKSYRADLAYIGSNGLTLVEVKGPHRFRKAGIAKAALAAKTYPQFRFELADWTKEGWKESLLSD